MLTGLHTYFFPQVETMEAWQMMKIACPIEAILPLITIPLLALTYYVCDFDVFSSPIGLLFWSPVKCGH
jgi:hypothetical protein